MHGIAITAHQMVPEGQILALADQAITAGRRQPFELIGLARRELDAVRHEFTAVRVIAALRCFQVQ
ncbi:hypothetical protein D3C76_1855200 [compost metagenome]